MLTVGGLPHHLVTVTQLAHQPDQAVTGVGLVIDDQNPHLSLQG
jgi:hypothetical protein